jgi:hypothetical protein
LQSGLAQTKGATNISLVTVTMPDFVINQTVECPFDYELLKISYISCMINFNYANAVNNQREREGKEADFVPQKPKWGSDLDDTPFRSHILAKTGEHKLYLKVRITKSIDYIYYQPSKKKIFENRIVELFLRKKNSSKEYQDLEKEIIVRTYDVKHIICVVIDKQGYIIKENL